jgi:hypothetical protein
VTIKLQQGRKMKTLQHLGENLHSLKEHQKTEDLKVTKPLASFKQENDALTNELDHLQKASELANADSQKGNRVGGSWSGLPISLFLNIGKHP